MSVLPRLALIPLAAAALPVVARAAEPVEKRPPNIVLILIDDMGWKDIACNGSKFYRTPAIDKLAAEGLRFTRAHAPCAVCSPSRAAILTGKNPARLHVTDWIPGERAPKNARFTLPDWTKRLDPAETTLPELLKTRGYTSASIGKWHLGGASAEDGGPTAHGFDINIGGGHPGTPGDFFWPYGRPATPGRVPHLADQGGQPGEYITDRLTAEAVKFIDANKTRPFFLYLPHYAVHMPITAKQADIDAFADAQPDGKQNSPQYAGMVKAVDDSVAVIMKTLRERGLEDNTIVIFTSDNGGAMHGPHTTSNAPLRGQKAFPYEAGTRVPLIIKAPGITKPGTVTDTVAIGTDFLPTLATLAGVTAPLPADIDGHDITPVLRGEKTAPRELLFHYPHYWYDGTISPYSTLTDGDLKIIRWYEYDSEEVYDLATDPYEQHDLAATRPEVRSRLAAKLDSRLKSLGAQPPVPRPGAGPAPAPETNKARGAKFAGGL